MWCGCAVCGVVWVCVDQARAVSFPSQRDVGRSSVFTREPPAARQQAPAGQPALPTTDNQCPRRESQLYGEDFSFDVGLTLRPHRTRTHACTRAHLAEGACECNDNNKSIRRHYGPRRRDWVSQAWQGPVLRLCSPLRHCVSAMIPVTAVGEPGYYVKTPEAEQRRRALDAVDPATAAVQPGYYVITPQAEQLLRALEWQRGNPAWVFCFAQSLRNVHVDRLVFVRRCLRGLVRAAQALLDVWREFENKHGVLGYPACVFCIGLLDATRGAACALRALSNQPCNQLVTSAGQALADTTSAHGTPAPPPDAPNPSSPDAARPTCATSGTPAPPQVSPIRTPPRSPRPADAPACDHSQRDLACVRRPVT